MRPLAHHAGEDSLAQFLLLAGGGLPVALAVARVRLKAVRTRLTRLARSRKQQPAAGRTPGRGT
ncbi:MAG TPA: hypothetical protein VFA45_16330 [Actinomycetes bacterium]|jgi:hypothetical protein|nr:hypothetical protein [Actinomycetes bacterium]